MPKTCTICSHAQRAEIDSALLRSESLRNLAKRYGTSAPTLFRHKATHIAAQLSKAKEVSEIASASALLNELRDIAGKTRDVLARALREKDGELALKAIARLERQLELKARLLGEIKEPGGGKNVIEIIYVDKAVIAGAPAELKRIDCAPGESNT